MCGSGHAHQSGLVEEGDRLMIVPRADGKRNGHGASWVGICENSVGFCHDSRGAGRGVAGAKSACVCHERLGNLGRRRRRN